jgi:Clp amino terminal domain, pathogenicity island component/Glyoxalase superfamily protein
MEDWEMVTINLSATGAKEAVARRREFLAANGISLKQTHAYEALAQTLGYANWNTLQALLSATPLMESEASPAARALTDKQTAHTDESPMEERRAVEGARKPRLSPSLEQSIYRAIGLGTERHHEYAALEHLLLSLTDDKDAASVLLACHINMDQLRNELTDYIDSKLDSLVTAVPGTTKPTTAFQRVVQRAVLRNMISGRDEITGANVVVALFSEPESFALNILQQQGMTRVDAEKYIVHGPAKPLGGGQSG